MQLTNAQREGRERPCSPAIAIDLDDMALAIRWACDSSGQMIDPHTAIGLAAARRAGLCPPTCRW